MHRDERARPRPARAGRRSTSPSCRTSATLYPPDDVTRVTVEGLTRQLEGASRPGHLDGLTTVMLKLHPSGRPRPPLPGSAPRPAGRDPAPHAARPVHERARSWSARPCARTMGWPCPARTPCSRSRSGTRRPACSTPSARRAPAYDAGERSAEVLRARMTDVIAAESMARTDYISVADASTLVELRARHRPGAGAGGGLDRAHPAHRQHAARVGTSPEAGAATKY